MDFGLAFRYVFDDEDWFRKIGLVALCSLIPVIGQFIVIGWGLHAAKKVIDGNERRALPALNFGDDLGRGFMVFLIQAIYSLPVAIIVGLGGLLFGFIAEGNEATGVIFGILGGGLILLGVLLGLLLAFWSVAAIANYAAKGNFGAAFKFKEIFALLKNSLGAWLLVVLGQFLAMGFIAPLGAIACGIGVLLTTVYATAVSYHLIGQAYNKSMPSSFETIEPVA